MTQHYLIFNRERSTYAAMFWRPNRCGYTERIEDAGRYSEDEARQIVENGRGKNLMIPEANIVDGKITTYTCIDIDVDNNLAEIEQLGKEAYAATEPANTGIDRAGIPAGR